MSKIPTVKEFCNENLGFEEYGTDVPYFMIEFAKLHVEAALKEASKSKSLCVAYTNDGLDYKTMELSEESVLNAYPLENIK